MVATFLWNKHILQYEPANAACMVTTQSATHHKSVQELNHCAENYFSLGPFTDHCFTTGVCTITEVPSTIWPLPFLLVLVYSKTAKAVVGSK